MIFRIIIFIVSLIVLGFAFYWFQVRVGTINAKCAKVADDVKYAQLVKSTKTTDELRRIDQATAFEYSMCLHRNGL